MTALPHQSSTPPLDLIVRFSNSNSDLHLSILSPHTTTPITLCTLIRPHLSPALSTSPLRLIHSGAILPPYTPLSKCLRLSSTGKSPTEIYIHCSISSDRQLSVAELEAESIDATALQTKDEGPEIGRLHTIMTDNATQAPPQGFDRLLSAGLSASEVASLRSQFLAVQAHVHTPDTMPSPSEMRLLEERWLDAGTPLDGSTGTVGGEYDDETGGALEDMLWGNVMGFFWAIGAIVWLVREEGVWSKRRQIGVVTGVLVNIAFCVLRVGS